MIRLSYTLLFLTFTFVLSAQSDEVRARAAFLSAQEMYGNGTYDQAVIKLEQVKQLLKSTNPRVEYLLAQCHYELGDAQKAQEAVSKYFELAESDDASYNEMLLMIEKIEANKDSLGKQKQMEREWSETQAVNTSMAYQAFIAKYPGTPLAKEAAALQAKLPPPLMTDPRDGKQYKTVWVNGQLWMAENLRYETASGNHQAANHGLSYNGAAFKTETLCPEGWHIPSLEEFKAVLAQAGITLPPLSQSALDPSVTLYKLDNNAISALASSTDWSSISGFDRLGLNFKPLLTALGAQFFHGWLVDGSFSFGNYNKNPKFNSFVIFPFNNNTEVRDKGKAACRCVKD